MPISRNAPCPCGSGIKYKKCCLRKETPKPEDDMPVGGKIPPGARIVTRGGERYLVSAGLDDQALDAAAEHFERRRRGQGPARQLADFCQPLIDAVGQDAAGLQRAMTMGMVFWNLALLKDESEREKLMSETFDLMRLSDTDKAEFWKVAQDMIARHVHMFPEMHRTEREAGSVSVPMVLDTVPDEWKR